MLLEEENYSYINISIRPKHLEKYCVCSVCMTATVKVSALFICGKNLSLPADHEAMGTPKKALC